jgi:40S ribosome biogenesis protein Tsr1 and BMS1 C-terminal
MVLATARLHHPLLYEVLSIHSTNMHTLLKKQLLSARTKTFKGQYVTIDIEYSTEHASAAMQKLKSTGSLAVFSLLKHENKLSIMHCNVQRNEMAGDTSIIKSKEELYFQVLTSAFSDCIIFSPSFLLFCYFLTL